MRTCLYLFLLVLVSVPFAVHGQSNNNFVPLQPGLPGISDFATSGSLPDLFNSIYKICIGVAATLAVLQIMRAGVMYMGGDSITEKKEARDLISMSVIGLVLVLSPVIVFSIINPKILNLDIGQIKLAPASGPASSPSDATPSTSLTPQQCAQKFSSPAITPGTTCDASKGLVDAGKICCNNGNIQPGNVCCAKPVSSPQPAPVVKPVAAVDYMWKMLMENANGGAKSVRSGGPFPTKAQCLDSFQKALDSKLLQSDAVPYCTCNAPRSTYPQCAG